MDLLLAAALLQIVYFTWNTVVLRFRKTWIRWTRWKYLKTEMHQLALTPPSFCFCAFPSRPCSSLQILAGWQRGWRGPALPTGRSHGSSPPAASRGGRWRGWEGWRTGGLSLLFSLPPSPTGTPLSGLWRSQRTEVPSAGSGRHLTHQSTEVLF